MALALQRYALIDGPSENQVFDAELGLWGSVSEINRNTTESPHQAPLYIGSYVIVRLSNTNEQAYTNEGKRINHSSGVVSSGIALFTYREIHAAIGCGYPIAYV